MMFRKSLWSFAAVVCLLGLVGCAGMEPELRRSEFRLLALGQALVEHDLRELSPEAVELARQYLAGADVCFSNLEVAIQSPASGSPTREGTYFHAAPPPVLDFLKSIGINMLSLSNNHAWDLGTEGISATISEVKKRGFVHAGTGENEAQAAAPGYLDTPAGRVALVAMASGPFNEQAVASPNRPGVHLVDLSGEEELNHEDVARTLAAVRSAARNADYVLVYQHNHYWGPDRSKVPEWQQRWARTCIDAGAHAFIGHGAPLLHAIEIYRGRPIFYSLGSFVFHTKTPVGHYESEVWESAVADCTFRQGRLTRLLLRPLVLNEKGADGDAFYATRGVPLPAQGEDARRILERLATISHDFGTTIEIASGEVLLP